MYSFFVVCDNQVSHNEGPRTMRATACGGLVGRHPVEAGTHQEASARSANARLGISGLQAGDDVNFRRGSHRALMNQTEATRPWHPIGWAASVRVRLPGAQ